MDNKIDIIIRLVIAVFLIFFFANSFGNLFGSFFTGGRTRKKKGGKDNFDALVRRQEEMLRSQSGLNKKEAESAKEGVKYSSETERLYSIELKKYTKDSGSEEFQSANKVLSLLDNARWGEGKLLKDIELSLLKKFKCEFSSSEITKTIRELVREDILVSLNRKELANFQEISEILETKLFFSKLAHEVESESYDLAISLSKKLSCELDSIIHASIMQWSEYVAGEKLAVEEFLLDRELTLPKMDKHIIFEEKRVAHRKVEDFITHIQDKAYIISALCPLSEIKKGDIDGALRLFRASKNTSFELVRKRYKKMASKIHPDRMASLGLSDGLQKRATHNFAILQGAFDQIKAANK